MAETQTPGTALQPLAADFRGVERNQANPGTPANWLLLPREHGAWGMVCLPFLAGAVVAGQWRNWSVLAALLAVFSTFLLRDPLVVFWRDWNRRKPAARAPSRAETRSAFFTVAACLTGLVVSGGVLLAALPTPPVLILGGGGLLLVLASVVCAARKSQRDLAVQALSVVGLTASSLLAYLAVRGRLEAPAFLLWGLSAAHALASMLVVRARLESIIAHRKGSPAAPLRALYRRALWMQGGLWSLLGALALSGKPWLMLPFFPPAVLHGWELWQFRAGRGLQLSLHRVGFLQLGASVVFYLLLMAVLP